MNNKHTHKTPNNNLYSIITPQKQLDSPVILTYQKPTSKDTNKEYLNEIQEQIDILEQKLFSTDDPDEYEQFPHEQQTNPNYNNNITDVIVNENPYTSKDSPNMPHQTTTETVPSQQEAFQSNERDELYQIILRERREYTELEQVRKEQDSKFKELQLKCNELSMRNRELSTTVDILQQEKQEQALLIKELENQITLLTKHDHNNNTHHHYHHHNTPNEMRYIFSKKSQPYNTYYNNNIKYK